MSDSIPLLMIPGPTNVPDRVLQAIAKPCIFHRGAEFADILAECTEGLQKVLGTAQPVITLAASGTGAVEAAVANILSPGQRLLAIRTGKFGERMGEIAAAYGIDVAWWDCLDGLAADPDQLRQRLAADHFDAVSIVYNETSTGVQQDIRALGTVAADADVLSIVDAVSIAGGAPVDMDAARLGAVITGSQKALMLPPGLAFVALSEAAIERANRSTCPRYYFDLPKALKSLQKGQTPYTPAVNLIFGLCEALRMLHEEGLPNVFAHHERLAAACRAGIASMGLAILPADPARASVIVTAVKMPEGLDSSQLVAHVRDGANILISGGQDALKGKIFRIGHLGTCTIDDLARTITAVAEALTQMDFPADAASAADAARHAYQTYQPYTPGE